MRKFLCDSIFPLIPVMLAASPAYAQLGAAPFAMDPRHAQAAVTTARPATSYTIQTHREGATTIREFVTPGGKVFGVAWEGAVIPDLRDLLGASSFQRFSAHNQSHAQPGMRMAHLDAADLVVHSQGHPRHFVGNAYLPGQIPRGVSVQDIR